MAETRRTSINNITIPVVMLLPLLAWMASMYFGPPTEKLDDYGRRLGAIEEALRDDELSHGIEHNSMKKDIEQNRRQIEKNERKIERGS